MNAHCKEHMHCGSGTHRGRKTRDMTARRWLAENPTNEQIVEMLEQYQRDLEQKVADVVSRIEELGGSTGS